MPSSDKPGRATQPGLDITNLGTISSNPRADLKSVNLGWTPQNRVGSPQAGFHALFDMAGEMVWGLAVGGWGFDAARLGIAHCAAREGAMFGVISCFAEVRLWRRTINNCAWSDANKSQPELRTRMTISRPQNSGSGS